MRAERHDWSRFGFTTGMAAAAAAGAAAELAHTGTAPAEISLELPEGGRRLVIDIAEARTEGRGAVAGVIKRAGPDHDITDGLLIEAIVEPTATGFVEVEGGAGIGRVTLPGLATAVGRPAINPVPLAHIKRVTGRRLPDGALVTIRAAGGAALAEKTFNPRLGIKGGISILGTSGLVRPMSAVAWRAALVPQLDQAVALGHRLVALAPGNLGARAAESLGCPATAVVHMGNFAGFMLRQAGARDLDVLVVGHLGKAVKLAAGYEDTHHARTPDRMVLLAGIIAETDARAAEHIKGLPSAEAAIGFLRTANPSILAGVAHRAAEQARRITGRREIGVVITDLRGNVAGIEPAAEKMLERAW